MDYGDFKIVVYDVQGKTIKIKSDSWKLDFLMSFDNFESFAKYIYRKYKIFKYVFEKGSKNGTKKVT